MGSDGCAGRQLRSHAGNAKGPCALLHGCCVVTLTHMRLPDSWALMAVLGCRLHSHADNAEGPCRFAAWLLCCHPDSPEGCLIADLVARVRRAGCTGPSCLLLRVSRHPLLEACVTHALGTDSSRKDFAGSVYQDTIRSSQKGLS